MGVPEEGEPVEGLMRSHAAAGTSTFEYMCIGRLVTKEGALPRSCVVSWSRCGTQLSCATQPLPSKGLIDFPSCHGSKIHIICFVPGLVGLLKRQSFVHMRIAFVLSQGSRADENSQNRRRCCNG